jgi:hypothetical protein
MAPMSFTEHFGAIDLETGATRMIEATTIDALELDRAVDSDQVDVSDQEAHSRLS